MTGKRMKGTAARAILIRKDRKSHTRTLLRFTATFLLLIGMLFSLSIFAHASWSSMTSGTAEDLRRVWVNSSTDVFAVGKLGTILHYNGTDWSSMTSGTAEELRGIWGSSSTDVFAAGKSGTILHYNGTDWSSMTSGTAVDLRGVWGSSSTDVFAVGQSGTLLHYNGTDWSSMTSGTAEELRGVWGSSSTDVFAAGKSGTILHYNGTDWSSMTSGTAVDLSRVWGSSSTDVFAVGQSGTLLHYNGTDWSSMTSGTAEELRGVWGSSSTDVFAAGKSGTILHYNGTDWSSMTSGTAVDLWGVWGSSSTDIFVAGQSGTILQYVPPTIQFTGASSSGAEGTTPANLQLTLSATLGLEISVDYAVTGGTASGSGADYTLAAGTATITTGNTTTNISATVVDDTMFELDETIIVTISNPSNATLGTNTEHTYTITDNDAAPSIQFSSTSSNGSEVSTPANLELSLSNTTYQNVTVDYAVTGGTASGSGVDYTLAAGTATITSGNTTTNISPTIVDDTMFELDETIIVTISNPSNGVLGSNTEHTYTITDNDAAPSIQFSSTSSNGSEATTPANFELSLSNTAYQNVTVDYALSGTATGSGTDYTLASGTATITAGNTTTNISATIVDDTLDEANETIIVTISNPSNATLGTNTVHTYTINDDDATPSIQFTLTNSSGGEATTPANLELSLSTASGQNVTVDYAVTSGTATGSGTDYTLASGTATITAGNTTTNISATIVDDSVGEANETIIVTISSPSNATLGDNTAYTYTINDNDPSKLSINQQPSNTTAGSTISPALTVRILDANDNVVTSATDNVTIAIANNAGSGTLSGTLTKAASNGVATFNDLSINNVGTGYTLTVTSGSLTAATSDAFNITSASAGYFMVTGTASKAAGSTNELTITAYDQYGNVATGYSGSKSLTFSGPSNAPSGTVPTVEGTDIGSATSVNFTSGVSDSGVATLVAYKAETTTVDVSDGSLHSFTETSYDLDLTVIAGSAATLEIVSGDGQTGIVGSALSNFFVVNVTDTYGNPVSGKTVTWGLTTIPAFATGQSLSSETTATDSNGEAQSQLTLGSKVGTYQVQASASSVTGSPVSFSATGNSSAAQDITLVSGSCQSGIVSTALASPFVVKVTDSQGNAVSGVSIGWSITTVPYGSSGSTLSSSTTDTDSDGEAESTLTLGDKPGLYKVEASVSGLNGSPVTFTATNGTTIFIKGGSYHKISLPYQFVNGNAESVLSQLGGYNPGKWRLFRYVNGAYVEYPNIPDFAPGLAYWLISANDETLVISGTEVSSNATVTLAPGWNQIGNPFKCSVTWDAIKAANASLFNNDTVADVLWGYDTEYLEFVAATSLDSWQGFWIYNASGSNVDLVIPYQ